jgi:hypothetical protein
LQRACGDFGCLVYTPSFEQLLARFELLFAGRFRTDA